MVTSNVSPQRAGAQGLGFVNEQTPSLKEYTRIHSDSSNDCAWLYEFLSSDAISAGRVNPEYLVRVVYNRDRRDDVTTTTEDFGTGSSALVDLKLCLASKHVRAVIVCHRDSSRVDTEILDILWTKLKLDVSFIRQHFDYKEYREEEGCSVKIRNILEEEEDSVEVRWEFGGRWNPIRLPSERGDSILRLSLDSECLSVCCTNDIVVTLVRSQAVYRTPLSVGIKQHPCATDLYAATTNTLFLTHGFPSRLTESSCGIVHFYARLLVLRCYEDYQLRHDNQPIINLDESDRASTQVCPDIMAMYHRRLELVKLKHGLSGYLKPLAREPNSAPVGNGPDLTEYSYRHKLQGLLTDVTMLLSLYDSTLRIYERCIRDKISSYKQDLASEQLDETRESKTTAISLGKLSNLAFLYLPVNFVCAMLGMNLSIYGQGEVPVWVFLILVISFSLLTYLPIFLPKIDPQTARCNRIAYYLTWRSLPAAFWFLAFSWTHDYGQNFEIINSGLAQEFLGYTGHRTKGWKDERQDAFFDKAMYGSRSFWKGKVDEIFIAMKEPNPDDNPTRLTV